ncbi:MAG: hypothetical protein AAF203_03630, partial [Pseudomonadota bacterium]
SDKFVNMIHGEDLAQFLVSAALYGQPGDLYIASDGHPQCWRDVIERWEQENRIDNVPEKASHRASKKIDNQFSMEKLQIKIKYPNFADLNL